jgi:hypothetical protein
MFLKIKHAISYKRREHNLEKLNYFKEINTHLGYCKFLFPPSHLIELITKVSIFRFIKDQRGHARARKRKKK